MFISHVVLILCFLFLFTFPQLCDFAKLSENIIFVYSDIETFKDEPQNVRIVSEEDIHVTEEIYKRPQFSFPSYR